MEEDVIEFPPKDQQLEPSLQEPVLQPADMSERVGFIGAGQVAFLHCTCTDFLHFGKVIMTTLLRYATGVSAKGYSMPLSPASLHSGRSPIIGACQHGQWLYLRHLAYKFTYLQN